MKTRSRKDTGNFRKLKRGERRTEEVVRCMVGQVIGIQFKKTQNISKTY